VTGPISNVPHAAANSLTIPPSLQTISSSSYSNFYLSYSNYVKNQTNTGLLIYLNGPYYQSAGTVPGSGLQLGVEINGQDYDVGFLLIGTLNNYSNASCCNVVAVGLASGTYTIQVRWKSINSSNTYAVNTDSKWNLVIQEVISP
jgi:hypothetical protein